MAQESLRCCVWWDNGSFVLGFLLYSKLFPWGGRALSMLGIPSLWMGHVQAAVTPCRILEFSAFPHRKQSCHVCSRKLNCSVPKNRVQMESQRASEWGGMWHCRSQGVLCFWKAPWCCEDEDGLGIAEVFAADGDGRTLSTQTLL